MKNKLKKILLILCSIVFCFTTIVYIPQYTKIAGAQDFTEYLPTLSDDDAKSFLAFIYNIKSYEKIAVETDNINKDNIYKILTGNLKDYDGDLSKIRADINAFSTFARIAIDEYVSNSENNTEFLRNQLIEYLQTELDGMQEVDEEIFSDMVEQCNEQIKNSLYDIITNFFAKEAGIQVTENILDNMELVIGTYNDIIDMPNKIQTYVERIKAALRTIGLTMESEKLGRYSYFASYLDNRDDYSGAEDEIFQYIMDYNFLAAKENSYISNAIDLTTWITGKDSWSNHREELDRWAEYLYQMEKCINTRPKLPSSTPSATTIVPIPSIVPSSSPTTIPTASPTGMLTWLKQPKDFNNHTYALFNDSMDWNEAKNLCKQMGGHLVTITSQEEQNFITENLKVENNRKNCYWIGLCYGDSWRWITEENLTYTNWAHDEPNNHECKGETYAHICGNLYTKGNKKNIGEWNDCQITGAGYAGEYFKLENFGFICEWENNTLSTHLFKDYDYNTPLTKTSIIYGNGIKNKNTNNKQFIVYADISASYKHTSNSNGTVKSSVGKVIVAVTKSDIKPEVSSKNKVTDTSAANIAKARIKNGQITVTAVGKEGGLVYLWVIDTGNKGVSAYCPIDVKLAPKKLEVQDTAGSKLKNTKLANGNTLEVCVAGLVGSTKTDDCTCTPTVDSKYQSYITVTPVDGSTNKFTIKATGLKNNKDTKATVTFKCDQNGKKTNFSLTVTK